VRICIDDATRLAYVELLADERATTCIAFSSGRCASTPPMALRSSG
jgi:hypothetical protein